MSDELIELIKAKGTLAVRESDGTVVDIDVLDLVRAAATTEEAAALDAQLAKLSPDEIDNLRREYIGEIVDASRLVPIATEDAPPLSDISLLFPGVDLTPDSEAAEVMAEKAARAEDA
ncbi:hypothetical protein [Streptomyces sp. NPDC059166]|uniref:hypothetical protein n=1 Tax=Streptomyces sp. NPDC059166 TaxID=3346752 RepID=UPI0036B1AACA